MFVNEVVIYTELLACKFISEKAREELKRACCPVHSEVPGIDAGIEIVELQHGGWDRRDRQGYYVWDTPREIQIHSRGLYLLYAWKEELNGYALTWIEEEETPQPPESPDEESLGDLDDHPF